MATSTLIQFLSSGEGADTSNRSQTETFFAAGAIAAGDWVALDTGKTGADKALNVIATPAAAGAGNVVGVALDNASAGGQVRVTVAGYVASANVVAATAAGASLTTSGVTAGRALTYATGTHTGTGPCGIALTLAGVGNTAEVWVFKRF